MLKSDAFMETPCKVRYNVQWSDCEISGCVLYAHPVVFLQIPYVIMNQTM